MSVCLVQAKMNEISQKYPADAYKASKNSKTGTIVVRYDDKNIKDEETTYTFNKDGSANSVSNAWGTKKEFPQGTFSDLMLKMEKKDEINSQLAKEMVDVYRNTKQPE